TSTIPAPPGGSFDPMMIDPPGGSFDAMMLDPAEYGISLPGSQELVDNPWPQDFAPSQWTQPVSAAFPPYGQVYAPDGDNPY
ncbi:hypothetical protein ACLQ24_30665, partial [Micromonospora sp. DT4]